MIDVIIPVYRGLEPTRRCIESVLAATQRAPIEVVVIEDNSPEPPIREYLAQLAQAGRITLHRNEANQGFVRTVNRGMALHPGRDVILLNSDTEVANDWVDRLRAAAHSHPAVATATPFSNNATICSYPYEGSAGGVPGGLGLAALDRLFASTNASLTFELPTAVGFCMMIRRDALDALGAFDAERFGRGYGEENDFSMRAWKAGRRNVLAADVFVYHEGAVSFLDERLERAQAANDALVAIHPEYTALVRDFIIADPLRPLRDAIDAARVRQGAGEASHVVAERYAQRDELLAQFRTLERWAMERDRHVGELHAALAEAQALVVTERGRLDEALAERSRTVGELNELIAQLRAGLAHAESLAFSRLADLKAIQSHWSWPLVRRLMGSEGARLAPPGN